MVTFDELPYQLTDEVRVPLPVRPGQPERYDYEYCRRGTCNLFLHFEPLRGWRHVEVTDQRTAQDFALQMKALVDVHYPEAEKIRVVLDNLSTHTPWALYNALPAEEARRIARRLEFRHTPKHGSWLNMAEIELSVLSRQCLDRRLPDTQTVCRRLLRNDNPADLRSRSPAQFAGLSAVPAAGSPAQARALDSANSLRGPTFTASGRSAWRAGRWRPSTRPGSPARPRRR